MNKLLLICIGLIAAFGYSQAKDVRRRDTNLDELRQSLPKEEWDAFWNKLTNTLGDRKTQFAQKLRDNQGNMDLTLTQFREQLNSDYPVVTSYWGRVKAKWNELTSTLSDTSLGDIYSWVKGKAQSILQEPMQTARGWWDSAKSYMLSLYNKIKKSVGLGK